MPIYEYECLESKHRFERLQSFSEPPVTVCPECGSTVRKVLQPVGIVFKGSGWYKTDSRPASSGTSAEPAKDSTPAAGGDNKAAGDGKPATPSAKAEDGKNAATSTSESSKPAPAPSKPAS